MLALIKNQFEINPALKLLKGTISDVEWPSVIDIRSTLDYNVFGDRVGALLLGQKKVVFGFVLEGSHVHDLPRTIPSFYANWLDGLRCSVPKHLTLTVHSGPRWTSGPRTKDLTKLLKRCTDPLVAQIVCDDIATAQSLTEDYKRCDRFIHLYVQYDATLDENAGEVDQIEGLLKTIGDLAYDMTSAFLGKKNAEITGRMEALLSGAYDRGFEHLKTQLTGPWGMGISPMTHDEMLQNLRSRFTKSPLGECPHKIDVSIDSSGCHLTEHIKGEQHIANWLAAYSNIEMADHGICIESYCPDKKKSTKDYIAVLEARTKFDDWEHTYHQMRGLYDLMAKDSIGDIEFFTQISYSNISAQRKNARDAYRQAHSRGKKAIEEGEYSESAKEGLQENSEILDAFSGNEIPLRVAFVVLVHGASPEELDMRCHRVQSIFRLCELQREYKIAGNIWRQTLPCCSDRLLFHDVKKAGILKIDLIQVYTAQQTLGLMPLTKTFANDRDGIEFISEDKQYFNIDLFSHRRQPHWAIVAEQRTGKSNFANKVGDYGLAHGQPVTYIDMPPDGDQASALEDRCLMFDGSHIDCRKQSINLLGIPSSLLRDDSGLSSAQRTDRAKSIQSSWLEYLMILGGPPETEVQLSQVTRDILKLAIDLYLEDHDIQTRYYQAAMGGFGSLEWKRCPTLADFQVFYRPYKLQEYLKSIDGPVDEALNYLDLRLSRKCDPNSSLGQAIARPSTVDVERNLFNVFSLRGLEPGSEESLVYCSGAYSIALQKSLGAPISHVIIEEAQQAVKEPAVVKMIADLITRYGKDGVRLGMVTNSFTDVADSPAGKSLLSNLTTKIIGPIQPASVDSLSCALELPKELLEQCASKAFKKGKNQGYMNCMVADNGNHTIAKFFPGWFSVSANASNRNEREARAEFIRVIGDVHLAMAAFALYFRYCKEHDRDVLVLPEQKIKEFAAKCNLSGD